ncbi:MAG: acetyl-CoA carboxylase biotin carboxyl carrier protein [Oscillospiraceae bacterium]
MNIEAIKELVKIASENGVELLEVESEGTIVKIKMPFGERLSNTSLTVAANAQNPAKPAAAPQEQAIACAVNTICSPMVGVFYGSPSPDSEPFVKVGDKIKKGDVLCVIEAMKLMNEITSEQDGEIAEICVKNGQVVEFSQALFKLV